MSDAAQELELLHAYIDEGEEDSYFRFLCNGKHVKYVTIAAGLYAPEDMCFVPVFLPLLPPFPAGDWNYGLITRNQDGKPHFAEIAKKQLQGIQTAWHPTHVDHLDLCHGEKLYWHVYEATHPMFSSPVVAKFAQFDWEIGFFENECLAYQWIDGQDIGPKFLGNIVEEGRIIGFLVEKITDSRHAEPSDLAICREKLSSLHQLGIIHGDTNKHNFLIKDNHAVLIDFDTARKCEDHERFEKELQGLAEQLADTSGRGGTIVGSVEV